MEGRNRQHVPEFTSKVKLQSIRPINQMIIQEPIIGKVKILNEPQLPNHELLNVMLECGEGTLVRVKFWGIEKQKVINKIKVHQILSFQHVHALENRDDPKYELYHMGDVSYELTVRPNTIIRRWKRTGGWEPFNY